MVEQKDKLGMKKIKFPQVAKNVQEANKAESALDFQVEEFERNGYTILEDIISVEETVYMGLKIDEIYQRQLEDIEDIGGEDKLCEIGDSDSAKHLMVYDEVFISLLANEKILPIIRFFLKENFVLYLQNGVLNKPNIQHPATMWHRDLPFQHYTSSRPLSVSVLVSLDDFTEETGGTYLLPGSHRYESFPSPEFAQKFEKLISIKKGSVIVFDSMVFHRAGFNKSEKVRRAISHMYTLPFIRQQISLPRVLKGKYSDDPFLRILLGYDCDTTDSLRDWRSVRIQARAKKGSSAT
jgi:ectoine hydroxylase-related dioxygenase (phytanoyl-CoA dioxygenase family)